MDLVELGRPAILIPTPGQPEQEYLACYLKDKGWFHTARQVDFDLKKEMQEFQRQKFTRQDHFRTEAEKYLHDLLQLYEHRKQDRQ